MNWRGNWRAFGAEMARRMAGEGGSAAPAAPIHAPLKGGMDELAHRLPGPSPLPLSEAGEMARNWRGNGAVGEGVAA